MKNKPRKDDSKRSLSSLSNRFRSVKLIKPNEIESVSINIQRTQVEKKLNKINNAEKRLEAELKRITEQVNDKLSYSNYKSNKGKLWSN